MKVAEIYRSIQGEGRLAGTESVFVRASGCNLRCHYCDTPFASWNPEGLDLSVDDVLQQVRYLDVRHVVLTGGEPMLFSELIPLCQQLREAGRHITIETAGTLYLPLDCDLMSISPKTSNSAPNAREHPQWHERHERTRHAPQVLRRLIAEHPYQIKFVVATPADLCEIENYLLAFPEIDRRHVLLMPEGTTTARLDAVADWLAPLCDQRGLTFCPRQHIGWFGLTRGT